MSPSKPPPERPYSGIVRAAIERQKQLVHQFTDQGWPERIRFLGGADAAFARGENGLRAGKVGSPAVGVAVVWDLIDQRPVDAAVARSRVTFPYVPGLLSFREEPLIMAAIAQLTHPVDAWIFDGQGRSHPRGVGLATHMGILLNAPSIGAAKSVLLGRYEMPTDFRRRLARRTSSRAKGSISDEAPPLAQAPLLHHDHEIARVLWMTLRTEPVIISQGHRCTLDQAVQTAIAATLSGQWLPEPTRLADELTKRTRDLPEDAAKCLIAGLFTRKPR